MSPPARRADARCWTRWLLAWLLTLGGIPALTADFLELDGIRGDATDPAYKDWIQIVAYQQSVMNPVRAGVGLARPLGDLGDNWRDRIRLLGAGAGRPQFGELVLTKALDSASPKLALACAAGTRIRNARLDLLRRDRTTVLLARIDLENVVVRSLGTATATQTHSITESLALAFDRIKFSVVELDVKGDPSIQHLAHWDLAEGTGDFESKPFQGGGGGDPDPQTVLNTNLLTNPGAEASSGAADLLAVLPPVGWQTTGSFTALRYDAAGGTMGPGVPGPLDRGVNLFAGGPRDAVSVARQLVDVAVAAPLIDAKKLKAILDGWLGGVGAEEDRAELGAAFLRADGTPLGEIALGPVSARDRGSQTGLRFVRQENLVPPGTRTIEVTMRITRFDGTYNDGVADSLGLTLIEGSAGPSRLPVRIVLAHDTPAGQTPKIRCSWPAGITDVIIEKSTSLAEGWTTATPEVRVEGEERVFDIPVELAAPYRFWRIQAR